MKDMEWVFARTLIGATAIVAFAAIVFLIAVPFINHGLKIGLLFWLSFCLFWVLAYWAGKAAEKLWP